MSANDKCELGKNNEIWVALLFAGSTYHDSSKNCQMQSKCSLAGLCVTQRSQHSQAKALTP